LIIHQDPNGDYVTVNRQGGDIVFKFDSLVLISDIGLSIDIDETGQLLKFVYKGSSGDKGNEGFSHHAAQKTATFPAMCRYLSLSSR
jgi:hypothetical protein